MQSQPYVLFYSSTVYPCSSLYNNKDGINYVTITYNNSIVTCVMGGGGGEGVNHGCVRWGKSCTTYRPQGITYSL